MNREFSPEVKKELEEICARYPERRGALLPAMRLLEREFGHIDEPGMLHVADLIGVSPAHVYGVLTFYTHYRTKKDNKYILQVCSTLPCALKGSEKVYDYLKEVVKGDPLFTLKKVECLANCDQAPCVQVNEDYMDKVTPDLCDWMISSMKTGQWEAPPQKYHLPENKYPPVLLEHALEEGSETIDHYLKRDGYKLTGEIVNGSMKPEEVVEKVFASGLRGRGGAGFPTGRKWKFLAKNDKPRYLVINADESEPATFKDKLIIEKDPHLLIEGMIMSAYALQSFSSYIYIRGEFGLGTRIMQKAVDDAYAKGYLGKNIFGSSFHFDITVHRGAGAYICGEETGLLSSLEGSRGNPKIKPPFPAVEGFFRCPTIVNNVETIATVVPILKKGNEWFKSMGTEKSPGPKIFSICGHVERPGNYEIPLGVTLKEAIYDLAGGIPNGKKLKAVVPGGISAPILTADEVNEGTISLDFESLAGAGTMLGSGGIIVMDEDTCMVDALWNTQRFFHHESCGQCTPCREGTGWIEKISARLERGKGKVEEVPLLDEVAWNMVGRTICVLADAAAMPTRSYVQKFKDEFEAHATGKGCPLKHGHIPQVSLPAEAAGFEV
jgi:NADH-quinone oxidoreductase subunit F